MASSSYRGRIAPSPTGFLHLGHARTFWIAQQRARAGGGKLVLRVEDIDEARCKPEFRQALVEDLRWFGLAWDEGPNPDGGETAGSDPRPGSTFETGPHGPYTQSERRSYYREIRERLRRGGFLYPCRCSRRDVLTALAAPHAGEEEPHYPGTCRPRPEQAESGHPAIPATGVHWRFRVPHGERLTFSDAALGPQTAVAGVDFGDFVVWRRDDVPAYQLAVVADDAAMEITEVVRGADLLLSTFRQLLLYRALGWEPPAFYHAPLMLDAATGQRLAKRHASLSLRQLRSQGADPERLRAGWLAGA